MRESLFKGKRVSDKEWVKGYLWIGNDHSYITPDNVGISYYEKEQRIMAFAYEVDPETVCQYTGLTDKNDRKIFEGDILSFSQKGQNTSGIVKMDDGCFFAIIEGQKCWLSEGIKRYKGRIIGNIFDEPELVGMEGEIIL